MNSLMVAKIIRVATIAPLMAFVSLLLLFIFEPAVYGGWFQFSFALLFLVVLPVVAYPLQPIVPGFRDKGREGQRNFAILMGVLGYVFGILFAYVTNAPEGITMIYWIYFISGIGIVVFNKVLRIRASGHACGVVGPISFLIYFLGPIAFIGLLLIALVYWASLKMKRHTLAELIWGSAISFIAVIGIILVFR
ncbi:hypothetical protein ACE1TH_15295 [Shouchella sp. JSM 1781072]|uniref:hypothetical protein n=1 Tax=Shouchella sp. JSM 1781072 TaxID=3344581 RepID=UPI0035BFE1CA